MLTSRDRLQLAVGAFKFELYHSARNGGLGYEAYLVKCAYDFDRSMGLRTPDPNRLGCYLIALADRVRWHWCLMTYVLFGANANVWEEIE